MDNMKLTAPDFCDMFVTPHNSTPGTDPSDEMLEQLRSQPTYQHWWFGEGAAARQAFVYPVMPRTANDSGMACNVYPYTPCDILIEMLDGRIAAFQFESAATFQLTGNLIRNLAEQLAKGHGGNDKPRSHATPYATKAAYRCFEKSLEMAAGRNSKTITKVGEGTTEKIGYLSYRIHLLLDKSLASGADLDSLRIAPYLVAKVILDGQNNFIQSLRENLPHTFNTSYFLITLHNYLTPPDLTLRRNRRQAYELLPLPFANMMFSTFHSSWNRRLARRIDMGHSPYAVCATLYGVSKSALRHYSLSLGKPGLSGGAYEQSIYEFFMSGKLDFPIFLTALDTLQPVLRPNTREEWTCFLDWVKLLCRHPYLRVAKNLTRLIREVSQIGWARIDDKVKQECGMESSAALPAIDDYIKAVFNHNNYLSQPDQYYELFIETLTIRKLLRGCRRWHDAVTQVTGEYLLVLQMECSRGRSWEWPQLGEPELSGYHIHALCDALSLAEEGMAMEHCVSTLTGACLTGKVRVFSLRDELNNRCSTFDLGFTRDDEGRLLIHPREHQGPGNSQPRPEWCAVVTSFMHWLEKPAQSGLLAGVEMLGRSSENFDYADEKELFDPSIWIGIEAVRRCLKALGMNQHLPTALPDNALEQATLGGTPIIITLIAPQLVNELLLKWMAPYLPDDAGNLRWIIKSPRDALSPAPSDTAFDVIVCDHLHNEPATIELAKSLIDAGRDTIVLMPPGNDIAHFSKHGISAISMAMAGDPLTEESSLGHLFGDLISSALREGHIRTDWTDIRALLLKGGIGKVLIESDKNIEEAATGLCEYLTEYQPYGKTIKGALFLLPDHPDFMEQIFQPASGILSSMVPRDAMTLFAAPFRNVAPFDPMPGGVRIDAFVIYG
jgi:hypothetical protein